MNEITLITLVELRFVPRFLRFFAVDSQTRSAEVFIDNHAAGIEAIS
ncbi:MAG: hypothetical protein ACTHN5_01670 [Phycisphaerae bacterium]